MEIVVCKNIKLHRNVWDMNGRMRRKIITLLMPGSIIEGHILQESTHSGQRTTPTLLPAPFNDVILTTRTLNNRNVGDRIGLGCIRLERREWETTTPATDQGVTQIKDANKVVLDLKKNINFFQGFNCTQTLINIIFINIDDM